MRILLIEDDINKMRRIAAEIREFCGEAEIIESRSYRSGLQALMSDSFEFVLLDMSLPTFDITEDEDGFQVDPFSGRNILAEMDRKGIKAQTVVITMFETFGEGDDLMTLEELDKDLAQSYPTIYCGAIYYNSAEVNWKESLKKLMRVSK
jgi:DNA-binding NarL/FixJ family response regulator